MISVMKWILFAIFIYDAFASNEETINNCPQKHGLKLFTTPLRSIHCNCCANTMAQGAEMYGCRDCNFDLCPICFKTDPLKPLKIALIKGNDKTASSLLNKIVKNQKEKMIECLMKEDENNSTILHYASYKGHQKIIKLLLDACGEEEKLIDYLMKKNKYKDTALHIASENGHEEIVSLLLKAFSQKDKEKLIDYVMKENENEENALIIAASKRGSETMVKLLLNALIFAEKDKENLFKYLMKEYQQYGKNTVLHYAANNGYEDVIELLLNALGEDENKKLMKYLMKQNKYKETALHHASKYGHKKIVKLLLQAFTEKDKEELFEYLLKENEENFTALNFAAKNNYQEIVELLLEAFKTILSIGEYENEKLHENLKKHSYQHLFSKYGYEKSVKLLSTAFGKKYNKKLFEILMRKNKCNNLYLLTYASADKYVDIVQMLMHAFEDKENLIKYLMEPNQHLALIFAARNGDQKIVNLLLNAFGEDNHEKLIEYVMKEAVCKTFDKNTALHIASRYGNENIVNSLLNVFGKEDKNILIEYVMQKNTYQHTALNIAYQKTASNLVSKKENGNIVQMLSQKKIVQRINEKQLLFDLQKVTQMFTMHKIIYTDDKKNLWALFQGVMERNTILQYLVTINEDDFINESFEIKKKDENN